MSKLELTSAAQVETFEYRYIDEHHCWQTVTIIFENRKFKECRFSFSGTYSREEWAILAAIEKLILEIEEALIYGKFISHKI